MNDNNPYTGAYLVTFANAFFGSLSDDLTEEERNEAGDVFASIVGCSSRQEAAKKLHQAIVEIQTQQQSAQQ